MARRKRYVIDDDGYYDPQLGAAAAGAAAIPVIIGAGKAAGKVGRRVGEEAWELTRGLRAPAPRFVMRGEKPPALAKHMWWVRILILVGLWLLGIYLIRKVLQNWVLGGMAWIAGVGVDFEAETKQHTDEELAKLPAGTAREYTDTTQVLKNSFLNPLALVWTVVFILMLMNALPEVQYE